MQDSERQIAVIEKIFDYPNTYNLYWMDKRLVVINKKSQSAVGVGLIPSLIGEGITKINESRKKEKMKNLTLDEILQKDKKSYAIAYEDIEQIRLYDPQSRWKNRKLEIKSHKIQKKFMLDKAQFEQLSDVLPTIDALKGKLEN